MAAAALWLAAAGCGDDRAGAAADVDSEPCRALVAELCRGHDARYCGRVRAWLADTLLAAEDQSPLTRDQAEVACEAIRANPDVLERYRLEVRGAIEAAGERA